MTIAITGANGFLGSATVLAARRAGHAVRAIVRSEQAAQKVAWFGDAGIEVAVTRFDDAPSLQAALAGSSAVIHVAAAKSGDYARQYADTVTATAQLLTAMTALSLRRLVAVSSFSLYDYQAIPSHSLLDEDSPLESQPQRRDVYAQVKLLQEAAVRDWGGNHGEVMVLRPGLIYGPQQLWSFALGQAVGDKRWLAICHDGEMPLVYVDNCADALVAAASSSQSGLVLNLVDDALPKPAQMLAAINALPGGGKSLIHLPLGLLRALAATADGCNRLLAGTLPLPGLLVPARLDARFKALRYSNARAKQALGWQPQVGFAEALRRSTS